MPSDDDASIVTANERPRRGEASESAGVSVPCSRRRDGVDDPKKSLLQLGIANRPQVLCQLPLHIEQLLPMHERNRGLARFFINGRGLH